MEPGLWRPLCVNRTLKSGPRWWFTTLPAVENSPVTAPFLSMPGRSGEWSPVWRRSLLRMTLAKPNYLVRSSARGTAARDEPCSFSLCTVALFLYSNDPCTTSTTSSSPCANSSWNGPLWMCDKLKEKAEPATPPLRAVEVFCLHGFDPLFSF